MLLHPDVNSSPTAEDEFVKLKLAYEYLSSPRRKVIPKIVKKKASYQQKKKAYQYQKSKQKKYQQKRSRKKEIEHINFRSFFRSMLHLAVGLILLGMMTSIIIILVMSFTRPNGIWTAIFVANIFYLFFGIIIFFIFFISIIPDIVTYIGLKLGLISNNK